LQKWYPRWWNLSIFKLISILNRFSIISLHKLSIRQHLFDTHNWNLLYMSDIWHRNTLLCRHILWPDSSKFMPGYIANTQKSVISIHNNLQSFFLNQGWHSHCKPSRENQGWHAHTPNKEKMESTSYWEGYSTSTRYIQYTRTRIISAIAAYITHALCNWYII
jgi:hypothetical protein